MNRDNELNLWISDLWERAQHYWLNDREGDLIYRKEVSRPTLFQTLDELIKNQETNVIEFGCGDGTELLAVKEHLKKLAINRRLIGYEPQKGLAKTSEKIISEDVKTFTSRFSDYFDLLLSLYVLNEVVEPEEYFKDVYHLLRNTGNGIFQFVNPNYAETLVKKGVARLNHNLSTKTTSVMVYPIFNGKEVFYLPVLNRSLEYYISTLESLNFKINNIKHISTQGIDSEEFERVYNNPENPHFPEILSIPSTSQIVVSKK